MGTSMLYCTTTRSPLLSQSYEGLIIYIVVLVTLLYIVLFVLVLLVPPSPSIRCKNYLRHCDSYHNFYNGESPPHSLYLVVSPHYSVVTR
jgi:hypothetical protein